MHFAPRGSREKRSRILPPVRLDEEEYKIVEQLVEQLSVQDGRKYTITDIVRLGLGKLHEAHLAKAEARPPQKARSQARSEKAHQRAAD